MRNILTLSQRSRNSVSQSVQHGIAFNRVLAIVTGSPADEGVLAHAADLVRPVKGQLHVLHVIQVDRSLPVDAEIGPAAARGEDILRATEEIVHMPDTEFEAHLVQAREIGPAVVSEAITREIDALVIGTSFPREHGEFSLGRDISFILKNAPCLVVLRREAPPAVRTRRPRVPGLNGASRRHL